MTVNPNLLGGSLGMLVLALLDEGDFYGYAIIRTLAERSNHLFDMQEGTLYPVLHKLENKGLVKSYTAKSEAGRKRKYYKITKKGRLQLAKEREEWAAFSRSVDRLMGGEAHAFSPA